MEQEQKALQERIENGEDVVVDNPTDGEERLIEMNVGLVAGGDNADSGDWTEDSGELVDFRAFRGYAFFSILIYLERNKTRESDVLPSLPEPDSPESPPRPGDDNNFTSDSDSDSTNSSSSDSESSDGGGDKKKTSGKTNSSRKRSLVQELGDGSQTENKASKVAD